MICENCGKTLESGEAALCEGCGGEFCEDCIAPEIHRCTERQEGADWDEDPGLKFDE